MRRTRLHVRAATGRLCSCFAHRSTSAQALRRWGDEVGPSVSGSRLARSWCASRSVGQLQAQCTPALQAVGRRNAAPEFSRCTLTIHQEPRHGGPRGVCTTRFLGLRFSCAHVHGAGSGDGASGCGFSAPPKRKLPGCCLRCLTFCRTTAASSHATLPWASWVRLLGRTAWRPRLTGNPCAARTACCRPAAPRLVPLYAGLRADALTLNRHACNDHPRSHAALVHARRRRFWL